jgi:hypothetical protein
MTNKILVKGGVDDGANASGRRGGDDAVDAIRLKEIL